MQEEHGEKVCVLSMPVDMGVAEFCSFVGAYLSSIREMRLVRRSGGKQQCLIFLRFDTIKTAALFYRDYNTKPVSLKQLASNST